MKDTIPHNDHNPADEAASASRPAQWTIRFKTWRKRVMSDFVFLIVLAVIVGFLAGVATHIFRWLIGFVSGFFLPHIRQDSPNWWLILTPVCGFVITGFFTRNIIRTNLMHGAAQLMGDLRKKAYRLRRNITFSPVIGGSITLGFGGSAGAEGPIAYTGAAIGSNVGQLFGLKPEMLKVLIGCGAAAGISGIFMSPIGGMLFMVELLRMSLGTISFIAVLLSCLVSYGVVFMLHGCTLHNPYTPIETLSPSLYCPVILLGVFCGFYSLYYSSVINCMDSIYKRIKNPLLRNTIGGLAVGTALMLFPSLYGAGYEVIGNVIHGNYDAIYNGSLLKLFDLGKLGLIAAAIGILLIKCFATGSTNSSGGVAGDFAPTLFSGCIAGFLFATVSNQYLGTEFPVGIFAFLGMAGLMSGAIEAPLMTVFIVRDLGLSYEYILPICLCSFTSYLTVKGMSRLAGFDQRMILHLKWFIHKYEFHNGTK